MADDIARFFQRIQLKPNVVSGHVASVTRNSDTGEQIYAAVVVGGNTIRVKLDPFAPLLAIGDQVRLEQFGLAASADYKLAGIEAGSRPGSGTFQVLDNGTVIGGVTYAGGDFITGQLVGGNTLSEYATGRLYHRVGAQVYGIEYPDGKQLFGHAVLVGGDWIADGANVLVEPTGVHLRVGVDDTIHLAVDGTAYLKKALTLGDPTSKITGGKTDFATGTGFFIGYHNGVQKIDVGDDINFLRWDGVKLDVSGTVRIGKPLGPQIRGGVALDFDSNGQPLVEDFERYAWRIYDASGMPKISLLTGTVSNPNTPAALFGTEGDLNYLWYKDGELRLKGQAVIDGGHIGGFSVTDKRFTSDNNRVILVNENELEFAEGLLLIRGQTPENAGVIAWRRDANVGSEDDYNGIMTTFNKDTGGVQMLIGVSSHLSGTIGSSMVFQASDPASGSSTVAQMVLSRFGGYSGESSLSVDAILYANQGIRTSTIAAPNSYGTVSIEGLGAQVKIGAGEAIYYTSQGHPIRLNYTGSGLETSDQNYNVYFGLPIPYRFSATYPWLKQLTIYYRTTVAAAKITSVQIIKQNMVDAGDTSVVWSYGGAALGDGVTGYETKELMTEGVFMGYEPHLIKIVPANASAVWGQIIIYGFLAEWGADA